MNASAAALRVPVAVPHEPDHARRHPPWRSITAIARVVLVDREPRRDREADTGPDEPLDRAVVVRAKHDVGARGPSRRMWLDVVHGAAVVEADDRLEHDLLQRRGS